VIHSCETPLSSGDGIKEGLLFKQKVTKANCHAPDMSHKRQGNPLLSLEQFIAGEYKYKK
jgi:hypothetical protein